jgi:plasmid stabilization system protein ParE
VDDLESATEFYDLQEPGVGDYFQDCLFSEIDSLILYAGIHRKIFGYHRLLSKRFPYAVYYQMEGPGTAVVHRVLDCRRDPKWTRRELSF